MKSWNKAGKAWLAVATALLITAGASQSWGAAANTDYERGCQTTLTKAIGKHVSSVVKALAACRNANLADPSVCDTDTATQGAITKSQSSVTKKSSKKCSSKCSISGVSCIGTDLCPPNGALPENCTAGVAKKAFEYTNMKFPGPYCEALIGHPMADPADFGTCAGSLGVIISDELLTNLYGSINGTPPLSAAASSCLAALVKTAPKAAAKMASTVAKCRSVQLSDAGTILANDCAEDDLKTSEGVAKAKQKVLDAIDSSCPDTAIAELDICGAGLGATTSQADAKTCIGAVLDEVAISVANAEDRPYAITSIINAAYPSTGAPRCGDNLVNQLPNQFLLNGEECDGTDDSACPGHCLPPGDTFECTCDNIPRVRAFADGFSADLDNGWTGDSHNSKVTDGAGFVSTVSNCDCDLFDSVDKDTCVTGHSSDPVCDTFAAVKPKCSNRIDENLSCDEAGNNNGSNRDSDCQACDAFAANAGDYCTGSARFCVNGANSGQRCNEAADCPGGSCTGSGLCVGGGAANKGCSGSVGCGVCTGGPTPGAQCSTNTNCGVGGTCGSLGSCSLGTTCFGGANDGDGCSNDGQCPGGRCAASSDCQAQCYPEGSNTPTGPCAKESDCAEGERCRGICNKNTAINYCLKIRNGAPLPLSSKGTSVCLDSQFFSDAVGTKNIITGAHAVSFELRSVTYLATSVSARPCPVCGGWCSNVDSGGRAYTLCEGTCTAGPLECRSGTLAGNTCTTNTDCNGAICGNQKCRFDDDCSAGTCTGANSPECVGGTCRIDNSCGGGSNQGLPCRIEANTVFGTTSVDCPPEIAGNISGDGLAINWNPLTSGVVHLTNPGACDASGYGNYSCNCVKYVGPQGGTIGSTRTQPNSCEAACTAAGPLYGAHCSALTTCVGGADDGVACDSNSDCSLNSCTGNPKVCGAGSTGHCSVRRCSGGPRNGLTCFFDDNCAGNAQNPTNGTCTAAAACTIGGPACSEGSCIANDCTSAAQCDNGATCDDACPGGICTPLCLAKGTCNGGDKNGLNCAIDSDCIGGGTCQDQDPEEGACAQGYYAHCDGPGWEWVSCTLNQADTQIGCEAGNDNVVGTSDDNFGAGYCRALISNCFYDNGFAEGGTTANGKGDPTNTLSVSAFCIPASTSDAVNAVAGLPGPGRIRQAGLSVPNFTHLP